MKKFILFVALVSVSVLFYGQVKISDVKYENNAYSQIFETSISVADQYRNAKQWIAKTFGSYKDVVQLEDEETHKIILKGKMALPDEHSVSGTGCMLTDKITSSFTMTIEIKEGRFRVKIEDVSLSIIAELSCFMADSRSDKYNMTLEEYKKWSKRESPSDFSMRMKTADLINSLIKEINTVDDF